MSMQQKDLYEDIKGQIKANLFTDIKNNGIGQNQTGGTAGHYEAQTNMQFAYVYCLQRNKAHIYLQKQIYYWKS